MKATLYLIHIRLLQSWRLLMSVGWPLLIIGLPLIAILCLGIFERSSDGYSLTFIVLGLILSTHFYRGDYWHLRQLGFHPKIIFCLEYLAIGTTWGAINWILVGDWYNLFAIILGSGVIALLPKYDVAALKSFFFFPVDALSVEGFEWRIGMRKTGWVVAVITVVPIFLSVYSPLIPLVSLILLHISTTSWYKDFEPISMFRYAPTPLMFLSEKIGRHIVLSTLISTPLMISFCLYHTDLWYLLVVVMVFGYLINSFAICYKYAAYHPSRREGHSEVAVGIFSLCCLVPFFAPVCIFYLVVYSRRAHSNLNYLYAHC